MCYIHNLFEPYAVGGAERVVEARMLEQKTKGNTPFLITAKPWTGWKSWKPELSEEEGMRVYRVWFPNVAFYGHISKYPFLFRVCWHLMNLFQWWGARIIKDILQKEKPDVVETHNLMGIGFQTPRVIQRLHIRHRHVLHDVQLVEPSGILAWNHQKDSLFQQVYAWYIRRCFGNPDEVESPSYFLQDFYTQRGFFSYTTWMVGSQSLLTDVAGRQKQETKNKKHVLFVGSLVSHKGIQVLMDAWDALDEYMKKEYVLDIVGGGVLETAVRDWAKQYGTVTVHGRLSSKEALYGLYQTQPLLIFPSIALENRPNVIVEAMHFGLHIIASDTGGVKELVGAYPCADIIVPNDTNVLSQAIKRHFKEE